MNYQNIIIIRGELMIINYDYLKNKHLVSVRAENIEDEKYLLQKAIHISRGKKNKQLQGIVKLEDLIITLKTKGELYR